MTTAVERAARLAARLREYGIDPGEDGIEESIPYWAAYVCPCCGSTQRVRQTVKRWDADPDYLRSRLHVICTLRTAELEALGVRIDIPVQRMGDVLDGAGIVFMFAPTMHPAMRHVGPVRRELAIQTVMNLVGPLANPARAGRHGTSAHAGQHRAPAPAGGQRIHG